MTDFTSPLTRRTALGVALAGGAASVLAACGGGSSSKKDDKPQSGGGGAPKRGGRFRAGISGGGSADTIDAHNPYTIIDQARVYQLFQPLLLLNEDFTFENVMAESVEPNATATKWTIRLKPDLEFHNGKTVSADDLMYTLRRITDPKKPAAAAVALANLDRKTLKKVDARTVTFDAVNPDVSIMDALALQWTGIVPVDYDPKNPVGTGPFRFKSFQAGVQSVFTRFESYWRPNEPYLDEIVIVNLAEETARLNALLGGQVDAVDSIPLAQVKTTEAGGKVKVLRSETGAWIPFTMRVDLKPWSDERVRQAMRLIVDRPQMVEQALLGEGRIANDMYSPYDPAYASDLPQRVQDLDQAKSLLSAAGQSDLSVELVTSNFLAGSAEAAQVLAEQAKGAGVKIKVRKLDGSTFFGDQYLKWPFAQDFWYTRGYLAQAATSTLKGAVFNEQHWGDREYESLIKKARATVDFDKRKPILQEAQQIEHERGGYIVWSFRNQIDAYDPKWTGFAPDRRGAALSSYNFRKVSQV